jgi:diguanylate cyclase (GGDEF)-like protein
MLYRTRTFVAWGFSGLIPAVVFLVCSFTVFRTKRRFIIPFHIISLFGVLVMACGYAYTTYLPTANERFPGVGSPLVLVTTVFFLLVFASGARRYFAFIVLPPLAALTAGILLRVPAPVSALSHLSSAWVLAAAGVVASLAQERVFRNDFTMRALAAQRKEELELEIERVRRLNERLEKEIEERKAVEVELEKRAAMDELTGVYNRRAGMEILTQSLYLAGRNKQPLSVCFVDVDDLKLVNDNHGHAEGDNLLRSVIAILKKHLRKSDYVARIGGDEFIMVLPSCTRASADYLIDRIKDELSGESGRPYRVDISIGIAEYTGNREVDPELLVKEADADMYRVKQAKKRARKRP